MRVRIFAVVALLACASWSYPQQIPSPSTGGSTAATQAAPSKVSSPSPQSSSSSQLPNAPSPANSNVGVPKSKQQPKRILGVMPNYRAVSAGAIPPPPAPKEAFLIATDNSFDYSAFIFVGITSLLAEGTNTHPQLGKGPAGFGRYYWRGFLDKTTGSYMVDFAMPTLLHEDERYFAKGEGSILNRAVYAASRELITPNYHGKNVFNTGEILGRGASQAISLTYYPSQDQTFSAFAQKYAYAVGRDALTNVFREFWPDISYHLRRHPTKGN